MILSELSELNDEIKKLLKDRAAGADPGVKAHSKATPARRSKKVTRRTVARKEPAKAVAPSKPVLVPTTPGAATG
jgi:topoisomerase IA-like protein